MTLFVAAILFILGAAVGSFLSVVVYRSHKHMKGVLLGRSICPHCKKKLKRRQLIPIISFLMLRGKCGYCGKSMGIHYLLLELITGLAFVVVFLTWNFLQVIPSTVDPTVFAYSMDWTMFEVFIFWLIEFTLLIGILFADLMYKEIPDRFSLPAIGVGIAGGLIFGTPAPLSMLIGAVGIFLFFLIQFLISKGTWIGGGDLRMGVLLGVLLGWEKGLFALVIAYVIGAIFGVALLLTKKVKRNTAIAFAPFLIIGMIIMIFYGDVILDWYLNSFLG